MSASFPLRKGLSRSILCLAVIFPSFVYAQVISTVAGGFNTNGKPATSIGLILSNNGIAADKNENVYFAEADHHSILRIDATTGIITTLAGGGSSFLTEGIPLLSARFTQIQRMVADNQGNIYVIDLSYGLYELNIATGTCHAILTRRSNTSSGDGGPVSAATFRNLSGLTIDNANNLYVSDQYSVRKISAATGIITTIAGTGTSGNSGNGGPAISAQFGNITGLAVDTIGNVYVSDNTNNVIRKITASTGIISAFAGTGTTGESGDGGPATSATFSYPFNIATDAAGDLLIVADNRIRKVNASTGVITTIAGQYSSGYTGDGGLAVYAGFYNVEDICISPAGNISVKDFNNYVIRKITASTGIINTIAGNGKAGVSGIGGPLSNAQLYTPEYVAVDNSGHVFLSDLNNNQVYKIDTSTQLITSYASLNAPTGMAVDNAGNLYACVSFGIQIQKVSPTGTRTVVAGTNAYGHTGDGGPANLATLNRASGVAVDNAGNIYIADQQNNCIRKITAATGIIGTIAGTGTSGYSGDGSAATSATLNLPTAVSVDRNGNIYITDNGNNVIRKVDAVSGFITTIAGTGIGGFSGDDGLATAAMLHYPQQAIPDTAGNIYISDQFNSRVRRVDGTTGIITTLSGTGITGYNGDGIPANTAQLNNPGGLAFDTSYDLYIGDMVNERIRKISGIPASFAAGIVTGIVFYDNNGNGVKDADEDYADSIPASLTKTGFHLSSMTKNGVFRLQADPGTYTLSLDSIPYYTASPAAHTLTLTSQGDTVFFGLQPIPGKQDLQIALVPTDAARPGTPTTYRVFYRNAGTVPVNNVSVSYVFTNRGYLLKTVPAYTSISADSSTLTWQVNTLAPAQTGSIDITVGLYAPPVTNLNDYLHSYAYVDPVTGDLTPSDDTAKLSQLVIGSLDPNEKLESHGGTITPAQVAAGEYLNYSILFQNTGTATALNIMVRDTLDSQLDWTSFQMEGASHPYQLSTDGNGHFSWSFNDILLPDSSTNQASSHGFIRFRIKPKNTLQTGNIISGRSSIYFDSNPPVMTNSVQTTVADIPTSTPKPTANISAAYCDSAGIQKAKISGLPTGATAWVRVNSVGLMVDSTGAFTWAPAQLSVGQNVLHVGYSDAAGENEAAYTFTVAAAVDPIVTLSASQTDVAPTDIVTITATNIQGGGSAPQYSFALDRSFSKILQASGPANAVSIPANKLVEGNNWIFAKMTTSESCYTNLTATDSIKLTRHTVALGIRNPDDSGVYIYSYPNPVSTSMTITGLSTQKTYLLQVFNNLGNRIENIMTSGVQSKTLYTGGWGVGNYRISITDMTAGKHLGVLSVNKL